MPKQPNIGDAVTLLQHGLQYSAEVTDVRDDGTIDLRAIAINNGQPFDTSRVKRAPKGFEGGASADPFWAPVAEAKTEAKPTTATEAKS